MTRARDRRRYPTLTDEQSLEPFRAENHPLQPWRYTLTPRLVLNPRRGRGRPDARLAPLVPGIETNRVKKIADITTADLEAVDDGMTMCSKWEGGHGHALAMNERPPQPAELKLDIDALEAWIASVEKRRQ